jgi:thymidylate synthase (FAD)
MEENKIINTLKNVSQSNEIAELVSITPDAEEIITYCARVSAPNNQLNFNNSAKLIKYLITNKHWSPFELATITIQVKTSRGISPQILRHRSFTFQEFCLAGDSEITTIMPNGVTNKIRIDKLFEKQNYLNYKDLKLRVFDEETKTFTTAPLKEVFNSGIKPSYKITLSNGKTITSTKEHKFLTKNGFLSLEEIVGLDTTYHTMSKVGIVATNGIEVHRDYSWMKAKRDEYLSEVEIAKLANCSRATIHKWIAKLKLTDTPEKAKERAVKVSKRIHGGPWNKNKFGYKTSLVVSSEHKEKIRIARSGVNSNWWKGGVNRGFRQEVWDFVNKHRKSILEQYKYTCQECGKVGGKFQLHHVVPVFEDRSRAKDLTNIIPLHKDCHSKVHKKQHHYKIWKEIGKGNTLTIKWATIEKIEFMGNIATYDLEVDHISHNYIANGIVVHNSQRYAAVDSSGLILYAARRQDDKNRQNSIDDISDDIKREWEQRQISNWKQSFEHSQRSALGLSCHLVVLQHCT